MKKYVLTLAAAMFAGAMFAQSAEDKAAAKAAKEAAKAAKKAAMELYNKGYKCYDASNTAMNEFNSFRQYEKNPEKVAAKQEELNTKMYNLAKEGSPLLTQAFATGLVDEKKLFDGLHSGDSVYYVHSYYPSLCPDTIATTTYGTMFSAALKYEQFYGTQFHPEKSGDVGEHILRNSLSL